jgi:hypothetical protein
MAPRGARTARGQSPDYRVHRHSGYISFSAAFAGRLQELRWIEGRTVTIEYRWSEGRLERVAEIAAEFVRLKVDLIVAYGSAGATLKQATASIPIVLAPALDPVGLGLVASLSHPGENVTALSLQASDAAGKRLELLRDTVPKLGRLGILFDGGTAAAVQEKGRGSGCGSHARSRSRAIIRDTASGGYRIRFRCFQRQSGRALRNGNFSDFY